LRVAEVAARTGFASNAHFSRAFRAAFGMSPSDARAMALSAASAGAMADVGAHPLSSVEYATWLRGLKAR
jgi:AraC-like DNA-binding protein